MDTSKNRAVCLITAKQLNAIEKALSDGKRVELTSSPTGNVKIRVVYRKELVYNN